MIDIKYKDGSQEKVRLSVEISEKAIYRKELMTDEYVLLTFNTAVLVPFRKGDYIDTEFGRFEIVELEKPKRDMANTGGWEYELTFHAPWYRWTTRKLFYSRQKGYEKSWHMTQLPGYFMQIVIDNLAEAGFGDFTAQIDPKLTEMKLIEFDGDSIINGLNKIAEAWETEWWISDNILHLSKCEYGTAVKFEVGDIVRDMQRNNSKDDEYATRLYAFGSTRNIPTNYRKNEDSEAVIEGIVERRLKLPEGTDYIDAWPNLADEDVVEAVASFDKVYPRRTGTIDSITTETYRDEVVDDEHPDGQLVEWEAIRFKDSGIVFKSKYILPDTELRITFQSGALAGMDFEVRFNPDGADENKPEAQVWEIVRNDTYGIDLPSEEFKPQVGDTYILYGYDCQMVSDLLIPAAENELLEEAKKWLAKKCRDNANYSCPTNPIRCAGYFNINHEWKHFPEDEINLDVGQLVELVSDNYFSDTEGRRTCRIRAFEKRLDNKFDCTYEIGETADYSRTAELNDKIDALAVQGTQTVAGGGGIGAYIITRHDTTPPTDHNLYSALRSRIEFALKTAAQTIRYMWTFLKGLRVGNFIAGTSGAQIDAAGNAEFESIVSRSYLKVYELIYNRLNAQEGEVTFSDSGTIESITDNADGSQTAVMRRRWDGDFTAFQPGDVIYGYVNNLHNSTVKEYGKAWAYIESVDHDANTLTIRAYPDNETPAGHNMAMTASMMISRWGNRIVASEQTAGEYYFIKQTAQGKWYNTRQRSVMISCESGNIAELTGVDAPIIKPSSYGTVLGVLPDGLLPDETAKYVNASQPYLYARGVIVQDLIRIGYNGEEIKTPRFRGEWDAVTAADATEYYRDADTVTDIVTYNGCLYQCLTAHASTAAPDEAPTEWMQLTSRNYADYRIIPSVNVVYIRDGKHSVNLIECTVRHFTADGYTDYTTPEALDTLDVKLLFSLDGTTYNEFWVRSGSVMEADGETLELADGDSLEIGGNNVPWVEIGDNIHFYVKRNEDGAILDAYTVPVVRDGEPGEAGSHTEYRYRSVNEMYRPPLFNDQATKREPSGWSLDVPDVSAKYLLWMISATIDADDNLVGAWSNPIQLTGATGAKGDKGDPGENGQPGKTGLLAYPAGIYDDHTVYKSTEDTTPVVMDGRDAEGVAQYFVLKPGQTYCGLTAADSRKTPHEDAAAGGTAAQWQRMDRFTSIFADIIMADFGKLASAVFSGDLMFSEQGVDSTGAPSTDYRLIKTGGFTPNLLLDLKTGQARIKRFTAGNTDFSGDIIYGNATHFGKGLIKGDITAPAGRRLVKSAETDFLRDIAEIVVDSQASVDIAAELTARSSYGFLAGNKGLSAEIELRLYSGTTYQTLDSVSATANEDERVAHYSDTLSLAPGTYHLRAVTRFKQSTINWLNVGDRDYAEATWQGVSVTAAGSEYVSLRYGNGWIIGSSPANYSMAYEDENGNMVFQMQTKAGYGIKVCPDGLMVMADKYAGWVTLKDYIKQTVNEP